MRSSPIPSATVNSASPRAAGARSPSLQRVEGYDFSVAYVLPNSWKSALVPFFAGIPRRIGYLGEGRYLLLNERHRLDAARHPQLVQRYAALAGPGCPPPCRNRG
jgi:ADP-heptose:LPS heptosyltransferase